MTDPTKVTQHLAGFAAAFAKYPGMTVHLLEPENETPRLRVTPVELPELAEEITCIATEGGPEAVTFCFSWGAAIPGDNLAAKAAAVAYVLSVDHDNDIESASSPDGSGGAPMQAVFTLSFTAEERALSLARQVAAGAMRLWELEDLVDLAQLVASELASNAVREVHGLEIWLRLAQHAHGVSIECWDPSPGSRASPNSPTPTHYEAAASTSSRPWPRNGRYGQHPTSEARSSRLYSLCPSKGQRAIRVTIHACVAALGHGGPPLQRRAGCCDAAPEWPVAGIEIPEYRSLVTQRG